MLKIEGGKLIERSTRDLVLAECESEGQARELGKELVKLRSETKKLVERMYEEFEVDMREIHRQNEYPVIAFFNGDFCQKWAEQLLPVWDSTWISEIQHTKRIARSERFEKTYGDWDGDMSGPSMDGGHSEKPLNSYGADRSRAEGWEHED